MLTLCLVSHIINPVIALHRLFATFNLGLLLHGWCVSTVPQTVSWSCGTWSQDSVLRLTKAIQMRKTLWGWLSTKVSLLVVSGGTKFQETGIPWIGLIQNIVVACLKNLILCSQGRIEPVKVARGHATFIDCKMLLLLNIDFKFYWYKDVNHRRTCAPCRIRKATRVAAAPQ